MSNSGSEHSVDDAKRWISAVLVLYSNEVMMGNWAGWSQRMQYVSLRGHQCPSGVPRDCSADMKEAFRVNGERVQIYERVNVLERLSNHRTMDCKSKQRRKKQAF